MENPTKVDDLGVAPFMETLMWYNLGCLSNKFWYIP